MDRFPGIDLRIAGRGEAESWLRDLAAGRPNVVFEGMLEGDALRRFVRGARAVAAPSLVPETFGYVVLEAFAQARPVIGRRLGALPEILATTKGGRTFEDEESLIECLNDYADDEHLADRDGRRGWEAISQRYDEATHLRRYLSWARNEPEAPLKAKRRDGIDAFASAAA
jgi:glycosyltransferase involved in cell wall biosynthesis